VEKNKISEENERHWALPGNSLLLELVRDGGEGQGAPLGQPPCSGKRSR
jgi:hypothetical protein